MANNLIQALISSHWVYLLCNKVEYRFFFFKVDEECNVGVSFDDTFKADNHILSIVSRVNKMISWMVRNFISREANLLKIFKTLKRLHVEYCIQDWAPLWKYWNWRAYKVKLAIIAGGDQKALFSIATTPRCRGECYSFPWIAPLYSWYIPYIAEC